MEHREAVAHTVIGWEDLDVAKFLAVGSVVSVSCDLALYPFDLIKTRMQVQGLQQTSFKHYRTTWHAIKEIRRTEGHRGLYKGFGVTVVGSLPAEMLYYTTYEFSKHTLLAAYRRHHVERPWLPSPDSVEPVVQMATGALAEAVSASVWIPCDVIQQKLMVQGPLRQPRYSSALHASRQIWAHDGLRGFYRGSWATLLAFASYSAVTWPVYEGTKKGLLGSLDRGMLQNWSDRDEAGHVGQWGRYSVHFLSGFVSGGVAAAATNPLDVIKTRLQVQDYYSKGGECGEAPKYTTVRAMAKGIVRDEGWAALGKGVVPRMLYNSQIAALTFVLYEVVKKYAKIDLDDDD